MWTFNIFCYTSNWPALMWNVAFILPTTDFHGCKNTWILVLWIQEKSLFVIELLIYWSFAQRLTGRRLFHIGKETSRCTCSLIRSTSCKKIKIQKLKFIFIVSFYCSFYLNLMKLSCDQDSNKTLLWSRF